MTLSSPLQRLWQRRRTGRHQRRSATSSKPTRSISSSRCRTTMAAWSSIGNHIYGTGGGSLLCVDFDSGQDRSGTRPSAGKGAVTLRRRAHGTSAARRARSPSWRRTRRSTSRRASSCSPSRPSMAKGQEPAWPHPGRLRRQALHPRSRHDVLLRREGEVTK